MPILFKRYGHPLLQELLGADDLEARLMRRPLADERRDHEAGVDAAIEWAAAPDLAGIPDGDEDPLSPIVKRKPVQP